jgi:hypothetical protein
MYPINCSVYLVKIWYGVENILSYIVRMLLHELQASKLPAYLYVFMQEPEEQTEAWQSVPAEPWAASSSEASLQFRPHACPALKHP